MKFWIYVWKAGGKMIKHFFTWEFARFFIIGVLNTFNSWVFSAFYLMFLDEYTTLVLGYITAMVISYFLNCWFTFKQKPSWPTFVRFPVSYIPNFIIYCICYFVAVKLFAVDERLAYLISSAAAFPLTFLTMKLFTFRRKWQAPFGAWYIFIWRCEGNGYKSILLRY